MTALKEMQEYTFVSKYARWLEDKNRRETWKEAVDRVREMMLKRYKGCGLDDDINWAYDMMYKKKVLGSQRALQFGGKPAEKINARIYNCVGSYCDRSRFFQECLWLLLCGCGTGFSVQKHHVAKLPTIHQPELIEKTFVIDDSIEGWADALGVLMSSYFSTASEAKFNEYVGCRVNLDYCQIRPEGAPLSSGVGKAPGPEPLRQAIERIRQVLDNRILSGEDKLRTIDAYDIVMHAADAVLSGGVRRSATIALFSPDDDEMATAKTGDWREFNPQRARSNNSAVLVRGKTSFKEFEALMQHVKEYGEPGFIWASSTEFMINPCAEVGMYPVLLETGESGWQGCNLTTTNCGTIKSAEDFYERCRAAAIIGTLQAGFTDLIYLGPVSEGIFRQEALLGISMTGVMENFQIVLNPEIQKKAAKIILDTNASVADVIGIKYAARVACIKPEGHASCLLGTSSGMHPHHAKRYIRRQQNNKNQEPYQFFKTVNEHATEVSVWDANNNDENILFPIEVPDGAKTKNQLPAVEMLKIVQSIQENWVLQGMRPERCAQPWLTHNVSNTISVKPDEWDEVAQYVYDHRDYFCGVSFIPESGDKDYPQAPFTTVHTSREIAREYGDPAIWCSGLIELCLQNFDANLWYACDKLLKDDFVEECKNTICTTNFHVHDGDNLMVLTDNNAQEILEQLKTWRRCRKFAEKYFDGDIKRLTYCMKDVYNWKTYCDLRREFRHVEWTKMYESEDNTTPEHEISCAGGACLV